MPQERRKRGRRQNQKDEKEGIETLEQVEEPASNEQSQEIVQGPFFGLLDEQELAYFGNLDSLISANQFDPDEKDALIENTFAEIQGRELKIVTCMGLANLLRIADLPSAGIEVSGKVHLHVGTESIVIDCSIVLHEVWSTPRPAGSI